MSGLSSMLLMRHKANGWIELKSRATIMTQDETFYGHLFDGLRELAESSFPKKCASCGKVFESAKQFFLETQHINAATTGLKQAQDDDGSQIVEAFRNCLCGSTLMEFFNDRRDISEAGNIRRKKFDYLLNLLQGKVFVL